MKYRKKPVVIDAFQLNERGLVGEDWFWDAVSRNDIITHHFGKYHPEPAWCEIKTLEGIMVAKAGDYIIRGVHGELYPCKPDIFKKTYEEVEAIEHLKSTNWIPVSERLPEERDWFLAVFRELDTGYQLIPRVAEFINRPDDEHATSDGWRIIDFKGPKEYIKLLKCVAWMPLPEPYKED